VPIERTDIANLLDEYVVCRTLGHSWDDNPGAEIASDWQDYSVAVFALRCTRCTTERYDYIGKGLDVAYRRYIYPSHYTSIPGEGTRPNLRGEMISRSLLVHAYANRNGKRRAS